MSDERFLGPVVGPVVDGGRFQGEELSAYGELGLAPEDWPLHVEVVGSLPLRLSRMRWDVAGPVSDVVQHNLGLGDGVAGLRLGRSVGPVALSAAWTASIPFYDNGPEALRQETGDTDWANDRVARGQGTIDNDLVAAAGLSLGDHGWAQLASGTRLRNRGYATAIPTSAQVGLRPLTHLALTLDADWLATLKDGDRARENIDAWGKSPDVVDGTQRLRAGLGLLWQHADGWGILTRGSTTLWGRRSPVSHTVTVSAFLEFP